jgi:3-dehydroquinate dehydratase II
VAKTILVLNGPNLNLLGTRETETYGTDTLETIEALCRRTAEKCGVGLDFHQSNHEGELVDRIQAARKSAAGMVINAAAYSHTSIAILDALTAFEGPIIEVHISNIHKRERFRRHSYISGLAKGVICGCGIMGYAFAVETVASLLER